MFSNKLKPMIVLATLSFLFPLLNQAAAQQQEVFHIPAVTDTIGVKLLECHTPEQAGALPTVVLLHGQSGFARFPDLYGSYVQKLNAQGIRVCLMNYYDETDKKLLAGSDQEKQKMQIRQRLATWRASTSAAIDSLSHDQRSDPNRIGLIGFSRGAAVAVATANQDKRVRVLVDLYGRVPDFLMAQLKELPPSLLLHGEADSFVPIAESVQLAGFLQAKGIDHQFKSYPNAEHGFDGDTQSTATKDVHRLLLEFLQKYL